LAALSKLWNVEQVVLDTTGAGNVIADHLIELGVPVRGVNFNANNKAQMIGDLTRRFQHGIIGVDVRDTQLLRELDVFRRKVTPQGHVTYSSPVNYFDDSIIALALAAGYARDDIGVIRKNVSSYVNLGRGDYRHAEGSYEEHQQIIRSAKEAFAKEH
jgi:hypothetical protein